MVSKIKNKVAQTILEPSAGKGDIIEYFRNHYIWNHNEIFAIEKDEILQATLRGKGIKLIDSDFLTFAGADKFDIIIANPPFDEGDKHLLKAIDIMYNGEIIFLLNAETIKNPCTNTRKLLVRKLTELNAKIDYIQNAFMVADRKTAVEVALVYIKIENKVEDDIFAGIDDKADKATETVQDVHEIQSLNKIKNMVDDYNRVIVIGQETLVNYYRNYKHIGDFIHLENHQDKINYNSETLTELMQGKLNGFLRDVRKHYWEKTLKLDDVCKRLTKDKQDEFYARITNQAFMDFTESNIRQFVLNLINGYEKTLTEAVVKLFNEFTKQYAWDDKDIHNKNVHYFNGWKTNKAFFVNKKVIIPYFKVIGWTGQWELGYERKSFLRDIDLVMNYFDGMNGYNSIEDSVTEAFKAGQSRNILSTYFEINAYKKGTIHLTFRDENIRRRFNITACKGKGWLPQDYGHKSFEQLGDNERKVVESFEGKQNYDEHLMDCSFQIAMPSKNLLLE